MERVWVCLFVLAAGTALAKGPTPVLNKKGEMLVGHININEATTAQLVELPGIGPVLAERIVGARQKRAFRRVDDLLRVKGFGKKRFAKLRAFLRIEGPTELKWQAREPEVSTPKPEVQSPPLPSPPASPPSG